MATARGTGSFGESFACSRLAQDGYEILEQNWRCGHSEIDIIAQKGDVIAFVEVKTRAADGFYPPAQAVSRAQRKRIVLAAAEYLKNRGIYNTGEYQPRFDIFEVVTQCAGSREIIRHTHIAAAYDTGDLDVFV